MYCVKCGIELADSEKKCPMCGTVVCHPDINTENAEPTFPRKEAPHEEFNRHGVLFILTVIFIIPLLLTLICDISMNSEITWSGYSVCAIGLVYAVIVLPLWFRCPNPMIFLPVDFVCVAIMLWYIDFKASGGWFLTFALPMVAGISLIVIAVTALCRYIKKGYLYIYGGALILTGIFMTVIEALINITFGVRKVFVWSFYPLIVCVLLGIMLIIIAICRPLRESLRKKFFI